MSNGNRIVDKRAGKLGALTTLAAVTAVLLACTGDDPVAGSSGGNTDGGTGDGATAAAPRIVSFTAAPTMLPGGGGDAKLSFVVENATSLTIDNAVGDVTGKTSADVKVAKTVTYTLTAKNDAGTVTATAKVDVEETFTVSGKIVAGGQPLANAPIVVGGKPATMTSALGTFTVTGVKAPYDVAFAIGTPASVTIYKGLSRRDPTLVAFGDSGPASPTRRELQSVNGTITGGTMPYNPGPLLTVSGANRVEGIATASAGGIFTMDGTSIAGPVHWVGPTTTIATFHASTVIGGIGYYGKRDNVAIVDDGNPGSQNIAMNQVGLVDVAVSVQGPATFTEGARTRIAAGVRFTALGGGYENVVGNGALPRTGTAKLHEVAGSTFFVDASYNRLAGAEEQSFARKSASAAASTSLTVALADPARPTAPADATTNVTAATAFSFGALTGGIQRVTFSATASPTITVFTKETTASLSDITALAVALPKDTLYTWRVFGYAPLASLDDPRLADTLDTPDGTLPPLVDVKITAATPRVFTTAP